MSKRTRRRFSEDQKRQAVGDYVSGQRQATEVAAELDIAVGLLYKWKADFEQKDRSSRV